MKHNYKKQLGLALICLLTLGNLNAQTFGDVGKIKVESDASTYLQNYLEPVVVSASTGLANGWVTTARPHKLFGFDITLTTSVAGIPDAAYTFTFNNDDYESVRLEENEIPISGEVPTLAGGSPVEGYDIFISNEDGSQNSFTPISGQNFEDFPIIRGGLPIPMLNVGFGLPKGTEIKLRLIPVGQLGDDISLDGSFGVGVLHDIKQWIPGMKFVPMDISAFIGYNQFAMKYDVLEGSFANFTSRATTFQILASKKLLFFTPYLGLGFNAINSSLDFKATDPAAADPNDPNNFVVGSFDYENIGGARLTIGGRLKILWILSLNVDYTIQRYNTLNVGFGINFR